MAGVSRFGWVLALFTALALPSVAQSLPNHVDPSAREILLGEESVPAIRFLTTSDFPPFSFRDPSGDLIGFNIDLARRICGLVDVPCTLQAWPWSQAADALADNQGDALLAGIEMSVDNGERFDFSSVYLMLPGRFVTRAEAAAGFEPSTLTGPVAVRAGTSHEEFLQRYLPGLSRQEFPDEIAALEAVKAGEADAYFGDAMRASFWLNENTACCSFAGEPYFRPELFGKGMSIAVPAGDDEVRQALNWALVRLKENGALDELYLRWFPVGFY
ncbi:amino acid ABC transporter [Devosia pacifica]|uniref:Amino acid ABC transporter n=1 Tax=Devosia pacifica TaxID=1335967 RepID=A0A918SCB2_9HYPH|nr:transporter substrate-binding domain-containing protein [Devosia pacifica]GHA31431.1 amino acid ABC transporter [Devosia pacifica]